MRRIFPEKLQRGCQIRVVSPSRSMGGLRSYDGVTDKIIDTAISRLETLGLRVSFGKHVEECDHFLSSSIESRLEDIHEAFLDDEISAVLVASGGSYASQLLRGIDFELLAKHPKIFCGYSDFSYLANPIFAKSGLVTYYGPSFVSFGMKKGFEYTLGAFQKCLFSESSSGPLQIESSKQWSEDAWMRNQKERVFHSNSGPFVINEGQAEGTALGGCWMSFLQGTKFHPPLNDSILFLEAPWSEGKGTHSTLDQHLSSLVYQSDFSGVRGIVLGRFRSGAKLNRELLKYTFQRCPELARIPIVGGFDFGHTTPSFTFPIGGKCKFSARGQRIRLEFLEY